jgi:tRNA-Thr(GGU) m(6)t(6)A37 methyltransferase TsaA
MKRLEVLLFKIGTCGSCSVVDEILSNLTKRVNEYFGERAIELKLYDLEEGEGYSVATQLGITSTPTIVIHGERYQGKATEDELLDAMVTKLKLNEAEGKCLKMSILPSETAVMHSKYILMPIGIVKVSEDDQTVNESYNGVNGVVEIFDEYSDGLDGIESFSHITLFAFLDKVSKDQRKVLKVKPKWAVKLSPNPNNIPVVGVFNTHSPHRPNPIAITVVKLEKREGNRLFVSGLDLYDATPIVDIKPYTADRIEKDLRFPEWYKEMICEARERYGKDFYI